MKYSNTELRRGLSLIELVAAVSACSVILTTCAVLLHRVMRADSDSRSFGDIERTAARLSNQFRDDVHQASAASLDHSKTDNEVVLKLKLPKDQSLEYSCAAGRVLRMLTQNGKAGAREEFVFPQQSEFAVQERDSPKRIILSITTQPKAVAGDVRPLKTYHAIPINLQVEAVVNRDDFSANALAAEGQRR
jgi:type II secretory pathway component PulJ